MFSIIKTLIEENMLQYIFVEPRELVLSVIFFFNETKKLKLMTTHLNFPLSPLSTSSALNLKRVVDGTVFSRMEMWWREGKMMGALSFVSVTLTTT